MAKAEDFDFLALTDDGSFVGFMAVRTYRDLAYLFFLAIDTCCRSKGYGSRAIETLKAAYPGKKQIVGKFLHFRKSLETSHFFNQENR